MKKLLSLSLAWMLAVIASPGSAFILRGIAGPGGSGIQTPDLSMCAVPSGTYSHVWYIDPTAANGGNGSSASPWNSLNSLSGTANGTGPLLTSAGGTAIAPGDEILLKTGTAAQYGDVSINNANNSGDFVTVKTAPGADPELKSLHVNNSSRFVFSGFTVHSTNAESSVSQLVWANGTTSVPAHDVFFDSMAIFSADNTTAATWTTQAAWLANTKQAVFLGSGTVNTGYCLHLTNSHIFNTQNSLQFFGDNSEMSYNELDHMLLDGIDYGSNNQIISHNYIHDFIDEGSGGHIDGMQGFSGRANTNDILIDSNTMIYQVDPNIPFQSAANMSMWANTATIVNGGTSGFAVCDLVTLSNGVVLIVSGVSGGVITSVTFTTGTYSGSFCSGASGGRIVNSGAIPSNPVSKISTNGSGVGTPTFNLGWTVFATYNAGIYYGNFDTTRWVATNNFVSFPQFDLSVASCHTCLIGGNTFLTASPGWITGQEGGNVIVGPNGGSGGTTSTNVVVRNNIAAILTVTDTTAFVDHNIMLHGTPGSNYLANGAHFFTTSGTYSNGLFGDNNIVDVSGVSSEVTTYSNVPPTFSYDFHLQSTAPARGAGTTTLPTPAVDITGWPRAGSHDAGAYSYH